MLYNCFDNGSPTKLKHTPQCRLDHQPLYGKGALGQGGRPYTRERRKSSLATMLYDNVSLSLLDFGSRCFITKEREA